MTIFFLIVILLLVLSLSLVSFMLLRLGRQMLDIEEQVEESLDILDESYRRIQTVLEVPVLSDEPYVRQILSDIKNAQNAVLLVASKIVLFGDEEEEYSQEELDQEEN